MYTSYKNVCLSGILLAFVPAAVAQAPRSVYTNQHVMEIAHRLAEKLSANSDAAGVLEEKLNGTTQVAARTKTGRAEFHQNAADVFFVLSGEATLVSGGAVVNPQGTDEVRGDSVLGGSSAVMHPGDVVYVPPATAHQVLLKSNAAFLYVVVKVPRRD